MAGHEVGGRCRAALHSDWRTPCQAGRSASQLVLAIVATKEHLWEHITAEVLTEHAHELFHVLELSRSIEMFFDRAVYFAVEEYERYEASHHRGVQRPALSHTAGE